MAITLTADLSVIGFEGNVNFEDAALQGPTDCAGTLS